MNNKEFQVSLSAAQVAALYEMCAFCATAIHRLSRTSQERGPESFELVVSIQDKLDGCENLNDTNPSLLNLATAIVGKDWLLPELQMQEKIWQGTDKRSKNAGLKVTQDYL